MNECTIREDRRSNKPINHVDELNMSVVRGSLSQLENRNTAILDTIDRGLTAEQIERQLEFEERNNPAAMEALRKEFGIK